MASGPASTRRAAPSPGVGAAVGRSGPPSQAARTASSASEARRREENGMCGMVERGERVRKRESGRHGGRTPERENRSLHGREARPAGGDGWDRDAKQLRNIALTGSYINGG